MIRLPLLTLLAVASFSPISLATTISGVDHPAVPVGEKITFTGTGFTNTSAVSFFWNRNINAASFTVVSDTELQVTFPEVVQNIRDRYVLVESPQGSALTMAGAAVEFTGTGTVANSFPAPTQIIAKAGSVLQGFPAGVTVVYVESGAVLQLSSGSMSNLAIFAESGAVLDFRQITFSAITPPFIFYSAGTSILGSLPTSPQASRQIPPPSLHRGVGPFTLGVRLNVSVVGNGTATALPNAPFIRHSTQFSVTATPGEGALFQGWSGSIVGTDPVMSASSGTTDRNIVATFSQGHTLQTFAGSSGTITTDPVADTYTPGQEIQLTAAPLPGYQFVRWGGNLAGSQANPVSLVMDANKAVTAVFEPVAPVARTSVNAVDHRAVPVGETMTLTGTGFTGTTAVRYYWLPYVDVAAFTEVSDTELRVTFPNVTQNIRDRFLLIEAATGTTVTMSGEAREITGVESLSSPIPETQIFVRAGSILRGFPSSARMVYVESGAVLQGAPAAAANCAIFAEAGATLDFRQTTFSTSSPPLVIYSQGTTILGSLPNPTGGLPGSASPPRQVPSLALSRGIGPFTLGVRVNLSSVGEGNAAVSPAGPFVPHSSALTLTATPASGWVFQGWTGSAVSSEPMLTTSSGTSDRSFVATFTSGYSLSTFSGTQGVITPDPALETYAPGQVVGISATPQPGYRFVKWGGDLAGATDNPATVAMDKNQLVTAVFEPLEPAPGTRITAVDPPMVPVGQVMNFTGSGFTGTTAVSFFWRPFINSAEFQVTSDSGLQVTFPNVSQPTRERFVLVETPTGSTVTMGGSITEFVGIGSLVSAPAPVQAVVRSGSVLSGIPSSTRVLYVESGAVLRQLPASSQCVIFAEDGATLDLRGVTFSTSSPPLILHSPGTSILGSLPGPVGSISGSILSRQVSPLSLSRDIGPFVEGFQLVLNSEGPGTVTADPVMNFYPRGKSITLTATPTPGNHFIRWSGGISGTANPITFAISGSAPITARFSDRPDFFVGWRERFFTAEERANPAISGLDADPDGDQITNAGEYAFGSDPRSVNAGSGIQILPGKDPLRDGVLRLAYVRPLYAADINYLLQAKLTSGPWMDGTSGDITFEVTEEGTAPLPKDMERVTLLMKFTGNIPESLLFRLNADITDLP